MGRAAVSLSDPPPEVFMRTHFVLSASLLLTLSACSDASDPTTPDAGPPSGAIPSGTTSSTPTAPPNTDAAPPPVTPADAQTPATGDPAVVRAWLDSKAYTKWACEPAPHPRRNGSGHSANRICSNTLLANHGAGEYPVGAASVKELFDANNNLNGYAMLLKTKAGGAESFYWYENIGASVVANGLGDSGSAKSVCTGCHSGAGQNGQSGHDFVFTQVK